MNMIRSLSIFGKMFTLIRNPGT